MAGKVSFAQSGLSALKRFGEELLRRSETDPRLAKAVQQGYDLENPLLHGTNKVLPDDATLRRLFATPEPAQALNYTGGGRRAGPGSPKKGGITYPLVVKKEGRIDAPFSVSQDMPYQIGKMDWLKELGIKDPEAFREFVRAKNYEQFLANKDYEYMRDMGYSPDLVLGRNYSHRGVLPYDTMRFYSFLDDPHFVQGLADQGVNTVRFHHPFTVNDIGPKGRVRSSLDSDDGTAVLIANPAAVRSPFAKFEEEGVGLMKAKGGLVQMKECR